MYMGRTVFKRSIKVLCAHSEAIRFRHVEKPLVRKLSRANIVYPPTCQYPVTDPTKQQLRAGDESWKCSAATRAHSSYCEYHHAICYLPLKEKNLTESS